VIDIAQIQKARSRARARLKVNVQKPRIRVMAGVMRSQDARAADAPAPRELAAVAERPPLQLIVDNPPPIAFATHEDADAPFDPPDADDILGLNEDDETSEFALSELNEEPPPPEVDGLDLSVARSEPLELEAVNEGGASKSDLPECDREFDDELTLEAHARESIEEEPPFDPPEFATLDLSPPDLPAIEFSPLDPPGDEEELTLQPANENASVATTQADASAHVAPIPAPPRRAFALNVDQTLYTQPVPPITIHASWDRPDMGALLSDFAADPRMNRATLTTERGGLDGAILWLQSNPSPDLLILDSNLRAPEILAGLARLADVIEHGARIIFVGAVNDIGLMRELSACGIKYVVPPIREDDLARCVCGMYAEASTSRVIAVMGARGGVGASTIAHNIAWSIAERQDATATLVDFDLSFGAAAFSARLDAPHTLADLDETPYDRVALKQTSRLQVLAAPTQLGAELALDADGIYNIIQQARRSSAYVVLDLPHAWNGLVRQALALADDVLIVAGPDLASLRNADHIMKAVTATRKDKEPPLIALSMTGVPKRPEIPNKDFAQALGAVPLASFPYDPALYGGAAIKGQMLGEAAPRTKSALMIDALASAITGREPVVRKKSVSSILREAESAPAEQAHDAPLDLARPAADEYLARARDAAAAALEPARPSGFGQKQRSNKLRVAGYVAALLIVGAAWAVRTTSEASAQPRAPHAISAHAE